jgi:hypothetical protein
MKSTINYYTQKFPDTSGLGGANEKNYQIRYH